MTCEFINDGLVQQYAEMTDEQLTDYADNHYSGMSGKELARELSRRLRRRKGVEENVEETSGET